MSEVLCSDCVADGSMGAPSNARWLGPDNGRYCSIHFVRRFGHGERLVKLADYQPPATRKPPAAKQPKGPVEVSA